MLFCIFVVIIDIVTSLFFHSLHEQIIQITRGGCGRAYSLAFIGAAVLIRDKKISMRNIILIALALNVVASLIHVFFELVGPNYNNPYLMVHPMRSVWAFVIPLFWTTVLFSPRVKRYCKKENTTVQ
jgi:hypothetical protein